jgi:hypothetical protein
MMMNPGGMMMSPGDMMNPGGMMMSPGGGNLGVQAGMLWPCVRTTGHTIIPWLLDSWRWAGIHSPTHLCRPGDGNLCSCLAFLAPISLFLGCCCCPNAAWAYQ